MREPFHDLSRTANPSNRLLALGDRTAETGISRPKLAKITGGKALARVRLFRIQRELGSTVNTRSRKRPIAASKLIGIGHCSLARPESQQAAQQQRLVSPYLAAFEEMNKMEASRPLQPVADVTTVGAAWRPLGPFSIPHGQTYGEGPSSRPPASGRVTAIAIDPSRVEHILIGTGGGGVWETFDAAHTWWPRTDHQPSLSIGAVVFDPHDPRIAYAGTGEGDSRSPLGVGLLRSTNGGTHWTLLATQPFEGSAFFDLLIDPTDARHLLAATTDGLFRSTDQGTTWKSRRSTMTYHLSVRVAPDGSREFLAGCADGVFRSTTGTRWTSVTLPDIPSRFSRLEVVHSPSESGVAFAFGANELADGSSSKGYLWRRGTVKGRFLPVELPSDLDVGQAWYDWFAAVAPNNPDVIYLGAINVHKGIRSATGSWAWQNISAKTSGDSIHPDQHAIAFNPEDSNDLIVGNDGGIYRSPDGGSTWDSLNKGLNITEFEYLAQNPKHETWLLAGTQDNGTLRYQNQQAWYLVQDGDGGDCAVNQSSPHICFHSFYGMYLERSKQGGAWGSWTSTELPASDMEGLFYPPVEARGNTVAKAGTKVYVSRSSGNPGSWKRIEIPGVVVGTALAIPNPNLIMVGTNLGDVFRIVFAGGNWSKAIAIAKPRTGYVSDLLVDPTDPSRIWVTYSNLSGGHVFRSDDGGTSWNDVSAGLPVIPVNCVELDPAMPDTIFVAADVGVYRSDDAGSTWRVFNRSLPNALVHDLLFHAESRLLRAATQSRGVWEIQIDDATQPAVAIHIRDSSVDSGRLTPSPSGVDDPFDVGQQVFWWESPDIKVDSPTFLTPDLDDVDFELFEDDQSMPDDGIEFSRGLYSDVVQRGQLSRVYVQVHNRGLQSAHQVDVRVFVTPASATFPDLPDSFWDNFPENRVSAGSPWQPIGPHKTIPAIPPGGSRVIGFEWQLPSTLANNVTLFAISSAANDSMEATERKIVQLVPNEQKCALRSVLLVNPPAPSGPTRSVVAIRVPTRTRKPLSLRVTGNGKLLRGFVLPKSIVKNAGSSLKRVPLDSEDKEELQRLVDHHPKLVGKLDLRSGFTNRGDSATSRLSLKAADLPDKIVIALLDRQPSAGNQTLLVEDENDRLMGGCTFCARPAN